MSAAHFCKHCKHFRTEVMMGDGEPMDYIGTCYARGGAREADDYCPQFAISAWAKRREAEVESPNEERN